MLPLLSVKCGTLEPVEGQRLRRARWPPNKTEEGLTLRAQRNLIKQVEGQPKIFVVFKD